MIPDINFSVDRAGDRYGHFLNILRSQVDVVMRRDPTDESLRQEANAVASGAARSYASIEQGWLNDVASDVARDAWRAARADLGLVEKLLDEDYHVYVFESVSYVARLLGAQADRDVVAMAQLIRNNALRVDFYIRSGRSAQSAAMTVMNEAEGPAFRFLDRLGRNFKSSKHIRDTIRQNLINVYNEVYMAVAFDHGHTTVKITHPDPDFKWFGTEVAIVAGHEDIPLFYDIRDEVFHPSSEARITIKI